MKAKIKLITLSVIAITACGEFNNIWGMDDEFDARRCMRKYVGSTCFFKEISNDRKVEESSNEVESYRDILEAPNKKKSEFFRKIDHKRPNDLISDIKDLRANNVETYCIDVFGLKRAFISFYEKSVPLHVTKNELQTPYVAPCSLIKETIQNYLLIQNNRISVSYDEKVQLYYLTSGNEDQPQVVLKKLNNGNDGRTLVADPTKPPYSFIGYMEMTFPNNKTYIGSGTLVGPNHVLTAGHNLYSKAYGGWATKVEFYAGRNKDIHRGYSMGSILLSVCGWTEKEDKDDDMGMLILNEPLGYQTGWAGVSFLPDECLSNHDIQVTGYPGDKIQEHGHVMMWSMGHTPKKLTSDRIYYDIDTYDGQSGSPVWGKGMYGNDEGYYTFGIHAYGGGGLEDGNSATRISEEKFLHILGWLKEYSLITAQHPMLETLHWNANRLDDHNIESISKDMKRGWYKNLTNLLLSGNLIGSTGIEKLSEALPFCELLSTLELNNNPVKDEGAICLSRYLINNKKLTRMRLVNSSITDKGAVSLLHLITLPNFSHLDLSFNSVGDETLIAFADKVIDRMTENLLYFGFENNAATDKGAIYLAIKLKDFQKGIKIHLPWNNICSDGIKALKEIENNIYTKGDDYTVQAWSYFRYFATPFIAKPFMEAILFLNVPYQNDLANIENNGITLG